MAVGIWQEGSRKLQKMACGDTDGRGLLLFFQDKLEAKELIEALSILRMIWLTRNTFIFKGKLTPQSQVMAAVYQSMEGFSQAMKIEDKTGRALVGALPLWTKPTLGV